MCARPSAASDQRLPSNVPRTKASSQSDVKLGNPPRLETDREVRGVLRVCPGSVPACFVDVALSGQRSLSEGLGGGGVETGDIHIYRFLGFIACALSTKRKVIYTYILSTCFTTRGVTSSYSSGFTHANKCGGRPLLHEHEVAVQLTTQPGSCSPPPGTYRSGAIIS